MQAGAGKRKGSEYERMICKKLSRWISEGEREDLLWRSASSGAVQTIQRKKGKKGYSSQAGDIVAIDKDGMPFTDMFIVECKHYADLQLGNLVQGLKSVLDEFILKQFNLAKSVGKIPILIVRQNRGKDLLIGPVWFERQFLSVDSCSIKRLNCCIFQLDHFINEMPFQHCKELIANIPKS